MKKLTSIILLHIFGLIAFAQTTGLDKSGTKTDAATLAEKDFLFARDKELTDNLNRIEKEITTITSIERIEKNFNDLRALQYKFVDGRKNKANILYFRYNDLLNSIEIVEVENSPGIIKFMLRLNNRIFSTVKTPEITSVCANIKNTQNNDGNWEITYDSENCNEDPENIISVAFRFGDNTVKKMFSLGVNDKSTSIFIGSDIQFEKLAEEGENISSSKCTISIVKKYNTPVLAQKVTFEMKGTPPVIIENINQTFSGKGAYDLSFIVNVLMVKQITSSGGKPNPVLSGTIQFKDQITSEIFTYRILNQKYSTSW
jgi:hypothetical protein